MLKIVLGEHSNGTATLSLEGRVIGPDWSPTPESELLSGEAREILDRALERLPEHYRALLVLRDVEELSNEEVAGILGESVSSVKSRLHRARMALREILTRQLGDAHQV
jgi:RNA polymerase sigma-70 factor (ECF subfamily)